MRLQCSLPSCAPKKGFGGRACLDLARGKHEPWFLKRRNYSYGVAHDPTIQSFNLRNQDMVYSGVRMRAVACCIGSTLTTWQILESQIKLTLEGLAVSIASGKGHAVMRLKSLSEGMHSYCIALCVCACVNIHVNPIFCSLQHVPSDFNPKTSDTTKWPSQKTRNPTHLTSSPWVRFLLLPSDKDYETFQITSRSFGHQILVLSQPHGGGLDGGLEPWMICSLPRAIHR